MRIATSISLRSIDFCLLSLIFISHSVFFVDGLGRESFLMTCDLRLREVERGPGPSSFCVPHFILAG